ncbi:MAG TPA: SAM-dependent methyltransferase [Pseudonocardiaceae bacterium]|jgi:SAM-dependent methyltransferase|nr:SAM-dependent methyltransferase [Pseudonocardiaceae bacterium]
MNSYAVMIYPSANRVYADASVRLLVSELRVFDAAVLGGKVTDIAETTIGGVPYVTFTAPELSDHDVRSLSNLSVLYALFEVRGDLLRPVRLDRLDVFDSDLLTIQKYSGKTNELFTKLVLNVTALSTDRPDLTRRLAVLDPMCGRGTTLHQAMTYGYDASGIDIDAKDFDEYGRFIRTWLKNKRLKHEATVVPIRRDHATLGKRLDVTLGVTKERYKAGDVLRLSYVHGDTTRTAEFFRPGTFDVIVTDAPYGVQHGSRSEHLSRSPLHLVRQAAPGWAKVLRPGGALGISWNTHVASRAELAGALADGGLTVLDSEPYLGFEHRVDQAIVRDVLVARKAG